MSIATTQGNTAAPGGGSKQGNLYDILELILDKGLVIDVFVRVSLVGIELITIDARIVVASVDTYLRFAEACNRLDLNQASNATTLPGLLGDVTEKGSKGKTKGALTGVAETVSEQFKQGRDDERQESKPRSRSRRTEERR